MRDLKGWFETNTKRPLIVAALLSVSVWFFSVAFSYIEIQSSQEQSFGNLIEVSSLALAQKNRTLIEAVLHTAQTQTQALSVSICKNEDSVLASGLSNSCSATNTIFYRVLRKPIRGFSGYSLSMTFPRWSGGGHQTPLLLMGLMLMGITISILRNVQKNFKAEILDPLREGLGKETPLPIEELEEIRQTQQELQKAKARSAVAEALLGIAKQVSHDIRSPLSVLNIVVSSLTEIPSDKRKLIETSAKRINEIAEQLLKKRGQPEEANQLNTLPIEVNCSTSPNLSFGLNLSELAKEILEEKRIQYSKAHVEFREELSEKVHVSVGIDPSEISRVLSNLINNSVEAMVSEGGQVTVSVRAYAEEARLIVRDNGPGVPSDVLSRLGEEGFSYKKCAGSGLGLYHARKTAEQAGGRLEILSREKMGTMVTVVLPIEP